MSDPDTRLAALLPDHARLRLTSLRLNGGIAAAVLDAGGLDGAGRAALEQAVRDALQGHGGISDIRVAMTADKLRRRIVAVGSGKGGVGKSTVSANLAIALARRGRRTGLVDADIYGPSQPRLMGAEGRKPTAHAEKLIPLDTQWNVPMLSIGQLVDAERAVAWRGPMASGALGQLMDADWGPIDTLVVDLPPGTGDIQLTMLQKYRPDGAVIVSTPQDLALIDARRAMQLFGLGKVPVIGLVENMAGYACPSCGAISDPFGCGGAEAAASDLGHPFLGRIPLHQGIRSASDAGRPPAAGDGDLAAPYAELARRVSDWLDRTAGSAA